MSPTPPSTTSSSNGPSPEGQYRVVRKRNRVPLSCGPCRHRKLKCNRAHPCENCVKRGDAHSCSYAQTNSRKKNTANQTASNSPDDMQNRIDRLEGLVLSLMTNGSQSEGPTAAMAAISGTGSNAGSGQHVHDLEVDDDVPIQEESDTEQVTKSFGIMKVDNNNKSYYISDAHWASVLSEISEVKNYFVTHKKQYEEHAEKLKATQLPTDVPGSTLLFGAMKVTSRAEIMSSFPSKYTSDMLIARYFNCYDPATHFLHGPTFQAQYNKHWEDPSQTCVAWIGMLFAMMRLSMLSYYREGDEPPEFRGKSLDMAGTFRNLVAMCLTLADYTKPYPNLIECLAFHLHGDYCQTKEADVSVWVLSGVIVRLAMRMGYHRDSKAFPNITPFQGEMRRRVWSFVRQADILFSCQVGLPNMVRMADSDTELPRNLYDDDFGEDCKELPPSRPPSEPTPISYLITKSRLANVLGQAIEQTSSVQNASYDKVMEMDSELRRARDMVPEHLLVRPIEESPLDSLVLILSRFSVMCVYHRAQCMLHRKYLLRARENPRFTHSRRTCVDSAMELLRFQSMIHVETRPSGRLRSRQNRVTSLSSSDFLQAATILCLDLYHGYRLPDTSRASSDTYAWGRERREEILAAVQRSKDIWDELRDETMEAWKASGVLGVMLSGLQRGPEANPLTPAFEPQDEKQSAAMTLGLLSSGMTPINQGPQFNDALLKGPETPLPALGGFGAEAAPGASSLFNMFGQMPDMQANLDWDAWDNYIQGGTLDPSASYWSPMDFQQQNSGPLSPPQLAGPVQNSPADRLRAPPRTTNMFPNNGYSLRRVACRLLASPSPIPVRSGRTATPNAHRLAIRCRQFSQCRWIGEGVKSQLDSKDTATAQSPTATATATNITSADTNDAPVAPDDIAVNEAEKEERRVESEDGLNIATTVTSSNAPASEAGSTQGHDRDFAASTATTNAYQRSHGHPSTSTFDVSQIREAARLEDEAAQRTMTKEERIELMRQSRNEPKETIFIGNLFYDVTAEDLKAQMSKYGVVEGVNIIYDSRGISKGYGYVQFDNTDSADRAIQAMHMRVFEGRRVTLYFAQTNMRTAVKAFAPTNTLYIGNMPFEMTDRDLNELFKDLANVFDIRVTVDRQTGQFRGYVHAEFTDVESAAIGLEQLSRQTLYGRKLKVYYSNNVRKAQRGFFPVGA